MNNKQNTGKTLNKYSVTNIRKGVASMQANSVKNIVVLKNLPSNIVEEAIIILKSNKYAKKLQKVEKNNNKELEEKESNGKEYVIKEAEALLSSYISKIEDKQHIEKPSKSLKEKYQRLRKYSIIISILFAISFIINFA